MIYSLKKMVEIMEVIENELPVNIEKQLNDRSFRNQSEDSGLDTPNTEPSVTSSDDSQLVSSGYDSSNGSNMLMPSLKWENIKGEVVNWETFSLIMQSSNIAGQSRLCDISSIEHVGLTPKLRKGTLELQRDYLQYRSRWEIQLNSHCENL